MGIYAISAKPPIDLSAPRQCGKPGWDNGLHIDHLYPLSKGGSDNLDNVRPAHGRCNVIKSAKVFKAMSDSPWGTMKAGKPKGV